MLIRSPLVLLLMFAGSLAYGQDDRARYFNKREASIPFSVDEREQIQEVLLYASLNGGNWILVGKAHPNQKRFRFTTDRDGTYDFGVKTQYVNGKSNPPNVDDLKPSRRIVIDTLAPQISVRPTGGSDKVAGVEWEATDENIDAKSIRLEYRWPGQTAWLAIDKDKTFRPKDQSSWNLAGRGGSIEIRVRARDLAGNEAISDPVTTPPSAAGFDRGTSSDNRIGDARLPEPKYRDELPPLKPLDGPLTRDARDTGYGGSNLIYVKDKNIKLNYDYKVGPSDYKSSEIFVKRPQGNWEIIRGVNPVNNVNNNGQKSLSFNYDAATEGTYGFFIRIQNGADRWSDDAPNRMTPPMVEVMVDTTPPKVNLGQCKVRDGGDRQGILDFSWLAEDSGSGLQPESIKIEYATTRESSAWATIIDHQTGNGSHSWMVPTNIWQVYIRVTAFDRAGNDFSYISKDPVLVDLMRPSVDNVKAEGGFRRER